ncbi:MAG: hypothetical protein KDD45_03620 [Bdellovibrionales bacterium]|nr:hypothetical protein [Bdellovibrionales bacterium]
MANCVNEHDNLKKKAMSIGVYSGSFDPPTLAHYKIILEVIRKHTFENLFLYINRYGKKSYSANLTERKKMLELMFSQHKNLISVVSQHKQDKRIDYRKIRGTNHNHILTLIIGEDSYLKRLGLPLEQQISADKVIVIPRTSIFTDLQSTLQSNDEIMFIPDIDGVSSTKVRKHLKSKDLSGIHLSKEVLRYILKNNLYQSI